MTAIVSFQTFASCNVGALTDSNRYLLKYLKFLEFARPSVLSTFHVHVYRYPFDTLSKKVPRQFQKPATKCGNTKMSARWKISGSSMSRRDVLLRRRR